MDKVKKNDREIRNLCVKFGLTAYKNNDNAFYSNMSTEHKFTR